MAHDKYSTWNRQIWHLQNMAPYKNGTPCEKMPKGYICQGLSWVIFVREFLNLLYNSDSWLFDFKVEIFSLQNDIFGTLLCLIVVGKGSIIHISRVLVVLQKTNNVVVRCHLCWVSCWRDGKFDKRSAIFVTLCQWVA